MKESIKAYKSLEAYDYFFCGHVQNCYYHEIFQSQSFASSKHRCASAVFESFLRNGHFEICDQNPCKNHVKESFSKLQAADKKIK